MNGDDACRAQAALAPEPMPHLPPDEPRPVARTHEELRENLARMSGNVGGCAEVQTSTNPKDIAAASKCPLWLVPPVADRAIAEVLAHGAAKYQPWNWRRDGIMASNYVSAIRRHLAAWLDGEDIDPESGLSHLAHIGATAAIMLDAESHGKLIDDRPKG